MSHGRVLLIVNPVRGPNALKRLATLEESLKGLGVRYDQQFTERKGHATALARQGVADGYETVVAVGGDGTVNEVVNGLVGSPAAVFSLPLGAGNDFLRSLGIWTREEACRVLAEGGTKSIDAGLADYEDEAGERRQRYFAVLADVGLGSEVVRNAPRRFRHALGGGLGYVVSIYRTAVQGQGRARRMKVWVDGKLRYDEDLLLLEALNGTHAGGGLKVAPKARLNDALLDVFLVRDMPWPKIWALFPRIYRGTHIEHERAEYFQVKEVQVEAVKSTTVSVDGEVIGHTPAGFRVVPGALRVRWRESK
jgi:YegS/Rv2252/BmrU family lipid kinase